MIDYLHIDDIIVKEDRQRQEFKTESIRDLADSIEAVGLIHAPVVDTENILIVGERRLRAIELLFNEDRHFTYGKAECGVEDLDIPVHMIEENRPDILHEIELEENLRRENLTPMEQAAAIAKLHRIRTKSNPDQTMKDTGTEVASLAGRERKVSDERKVTDSLLVDQMKDDPDVQKAAKTSLAKAAKLAKQKIERSFVQALQASEHAEDTSEYNPLFKVIHADLFDAIPRIKPKTVDILLFDPPYGMGADTFGDQAHALGHEYEDSMDHASSIILYLAKASQNFMKENGHLLMFCNYENFETWKSIWSGAGWTVWARPLIWSKGPTSHAPQPNRGPKYSYECILFARRGEREVNKTICDVLSFSPVSNKTYAAEKPSDLLNYLLEDFVGKAGDLVLDPCCGSGSIFTAAQGLDMKVLGIELNADAYSIAKERTKK